MTQNVEIFKALRIIKIMLKTKKKTTLCTLAVSFLLLPQPKQAEHKLKVHVRSLGSVSKLLPVFFFLAFSSISAVWCYSSVASIKLLVLYWWFNRNVPLFEVKQPYFPWRVSIKSIQSLFFKHSLSQIYDCGAESFLSVCFFFVNCHCRSVHTLHQVEHC